MRLLLFLMLALTSVAQPMPQGAPQFRKSTDGSVLLIWDYGVQRLNTLSNVTTRSQVARGEFYAYRASGLPVGSTNTFVAFNDYGLSNMSTGVATPFDYKATMQIHSFLVTVPTSTNRVTRIMTSTNLQIWTTFRFVTNTAPTYQFVWTNDGSARFFHSVAP